MAFNTDRFASASAALCARGGVELGPLTDAGLLDVQREIGEARRALDALATEVAGQISARAEAAPGPGGIARRVGFRNAKALVADSLGGTSREAERLAKVGRALAQADAVEALDLGEAEAPRAWALVAAAVRATEITVEKAEILIETLEKLRASEDVEAQFVRLAKRLRPYDLKRVCGRELVLRDPAGAEERERRMFEERYLNLTERMDGMTVVDGLLDPMSAGHLRAWLDSQVRAAYQEKRQVPGDVRKPGQMRVDALATLAHHAMKCDSPGSGVASTMVVRIGLDTLTSGMGFGSCDSMQLPISVGLLRAMAAEAGIIPAVMGGAPLPIDVGRGRRLASPAQRIAVAERDGGCAWCHAPSSYCDVHHIIHWDDGGPTDLSNLVMLCVSCHHSIHYGRWRIEVKQGEVWFTPPAEYDPTRTPRKSGLAHLNLAA